LVPAGLAGLAEELEEVQVALVPTARQEGLVFLAQFSRLQGEQVAVQDGDPPYRTHYQQAV
jgi:hypothetical protein